jgi:DNA-binding CsgD family transcriptional regulator
MLTRIEFYNTPEGNIGYCQDSQHCILTENTVDIIEEVLTTVHDCYADAYKALEQCYIRSQKNTRYYRYLMASRFLRCNCGESDTLKWDLDQYGNVNIEQVHCPLRGSGDCRHEGIICMPQRTSIIKGRQLEIAELLAEGYSNQEIADLLYISIHTVHNLIQQIKFRLKVDNTREIASWYNKTYSHV